MLKIKLFFIPFLFLFHISKSQDCDLEIYSSNSQEFYLHINGVSQGNNPKSNYEIFSLPLGFYEAMVTFPHSKDTVTKVLGLAVYTKTTYAINYNERKSKYKIRFKTQEGFVQTPTNLTNNGEFAKKKYKPVKPNSNCDEVFADFYESRRIQTYLEELQFDEEKVNAIRNELRNSCYLSFTLSGFLFEIEQDYFKLELAKELAAKTYDLENLKIYSLGFKTNEFRNEYLNYIKQFE